VLAPLRAPPRHPLAMGPPGAARAMPATQLARWFGTDEARGLLAGAAAHSMLPLSTPLTASYGMLFGPWPMPTAGPVVEGGSSRVVAALWKSSVLSGRSWRRAGG